MRDNYTYNLENETGISRGWDSPNAAPPVRENRLSLRIFVCFYVVDVLVSISTMLISNGMYVECRVVYLEWYVECRVVSYDLLLLYPRATPLGGSGRSRLPALAAFVGSFAGERKELSQVPHSEKNKLIPDMEHERNALAVVLL